VVVFWRWTRVRAYTQKRQGLTNAGPSPREGCGKWFRQISRLECSAFARGQKNTGGSIRGITPVLGFALDEAQLRKPLLRALRQRSRRLLSAGQPRSAAPNGRTIRKRTPSCLWMMKLGSERDVCVIPSLRRQPGRRRHYCRSFRTDGRRLSLIGATQRTALATFFAAVSSTTRRPTVARHDQLLIFG